MLLYANQQVDYRPLELALKTGNAPALSEYFEGQIELKVEGGGYEIQNSYSKVQAKNILVSFFKKVKVKSFETKHSGASNWSKYIIGYLQTDQGNYRTLVMYSNKDGLIRIQEMEFIQDNGEQ